MKTIVVILVSLLSAMSVFAQDRIDTLYYSSDWKRAHNKAFADFYKVVYCPADSLQKKEFRDFYITGELQGRGCYIHIDTLDDANSIFDGEYISYFRNGQKERHANYKQGLLDGEYYVYQENGLIKEHGVYYDGKLSGIYTEFIDDEYYMQVEYVDGLPRTDYYILGNKDGNVTKFRASDNTPIWESPSVSDRKLDYRDGEAWQIYVHNSVMVALSNTNVKDYGKWHRVDIIISNDGVVPIEFDPVEHISASAMGIDGIIVDLKVWSSDEYLKKVNRAQSWAAAFVGFAEGLSASSAGYSTSTTTTNYTTSDGYGYYSGTATSYTTTYDAGAAYQARVLSQQRINNFTNAMEDERNIKKLGYLKKNTIFPGETISGYVHIQRNRSKTAQFIVNIEGAEYVFNWYFGKKSR